jgi:RNA polymerase sigma factor (sigma-70 family)
MHQHGRGSPPSPRIRQHRHADPGADSGGGLATTSELIHRIRAGDDAAREELFGRMLPPLKRWARGRLPDRARALTETDDLVQASLVRALARVNDFNPGGPGAFLAYLHQILLNCIRDEIRRTTRRPAQESLSERESEALPEERTAMLERTLGTRTIAAYDGALSRLSEGQQHAVILRVEFGFSFPEIAGILGRSSANAARMQVARAMVRLAEMMEQRLPEEFRGRTRRAQGA